MATLLDNHNPPLSWKYYTSNASSVWTAPNWVREICVPDSNYQQCTGPVWKNVDLNPADVLTDIGSCKLPNMRWVIPKGQNSDHPGEAYQHWRAFLGGFDCQRHWRKLVQEFRRQQLLEQHRHLHYLRRLGRFLLPRAADPFVGAEPGSRRLSIRVSGPVTRCLSLHFVGYVNDARHDFGSILRFVEHNFGIVRSTLRMHEQKAISPPFSTGISRPDHSSTLPLLWAQTTS